MDGRRHSVDVPISRALVALRRVRSLRDPSTNSMSKFSGLLDNLHWDMNSQNAITLGFEKAGTEDGNYDNHVAGWKDLGLYGENGHLSDHETHYRRDSSSVRQEMLQGFDEKTSSSPKQTLHVEGCNVHPLNHEGESENGSPSEYCRNYEHSRLELTCVTPSSGCIEGAGSCNEPNEGSFQAEKIDYSGLNRKSCCRNYARSSGANAGDVLSHVGTPCLSVGSASKEGSAIGMPLYKNEDIDVVGCDHPGCGIQCFWSRASRFREAIDLSHVEERPLLLADMDKLLLVEEKTDDKNNRGANLYPESPRSLSQKFRPKTFKELVGQNIIASSLLSAISNGRITSLYLFHGPSGTGKTSASRIFAAALNCTSADIEKPCGLCRECLLFFSGRSRDVKEVDAVKINRSERIGSLIKNLELPPVSSRFRVCIIDDCNLLHGKTWATISNNIERLPRHVILIMITPDLDQVPRTAVLKSEKYHFQKVNETDILNRLSKICVEEAVDYDHDALNFIATKSNGSLRDAEMMLDQLILLGRRITLSLIYEVNGVVSDDELLELLRLALSSDASNTVKKVRELMTSRTDPLQLISQLANLIMDILAGKCPEGVPEMRMKLYGRHASEADMQQLSHALKILSDAEKQLRVSKNQITWLTVALLQFSSLGASLNDESGLSVRTVLPQDGDFHSTSSTGESLNQLVTSARDNVEYQKTSMQEDNVTLDLMWKRATEMCESNSFKKFLHKHGKLEAIHFKEGIAMAQLEFDHPEYVSKAERSWKLIASALQSILGCNVEIQITPAYKASSRRWKFKSFFNCSGRAHRRSLFSAANGSNTSANITPTTVTTRDKYIETCSSECGSEVSHTSCHGKEVFKTIRNSDGNALSIGTSTIHKTVSNEVETKKLPGSDNIKEGKNCGYLDEVILAPESRPGGFSGLQITNSSDAAFIIPSNPAQRNLDLSVSCKKSSSANIYSTDLSVSIVRSTNYCDGQRDDTPRQIVKSRCWKTTMLPFRKAWRLTHQSWTSHLIDRALLRAAPK